MSNTQFRNILGAAYHDEHLQFKDWPGVSYFVSGLEKCPETGRMHQQYYVEFKSPKLFSTIKKKFPKLHFEARKGTAKDASNYCKKGEQSHAEWEEFKEKGPNWGLNADFIEHGTMSQQGKRGDLKALCDLVRTGAKTLDDILCEDPMAIHQYGRTLKLCEDYYFRSVKRTEMTTCTWYVGPTGAGKSHKAYTEHPDAYDYPYDDDWCDGYRAQDTMIINDFRGQIPYSKLLRYIDKWPMTVRVRNSQPRPFVSKHIVITSCKTPEQCYFNLASCDSIDQLLRRVTVVNLKKRKRSGV